MAHSVCLLGEVLQGESMKTYPRSLPPYCRGRMDGEYCVELQPRHIITKQVYVCTPILTECPYRQGTGYFTMTVIFSVTCWQQRGERKREQREEEEKNVSQSCRWCLGQYVFPFLRSLMSQSQKTHAKLRMLRTFLDCGLDNGE